MSSCHQARELFGAYWDDETTRAEREWLDAHFAACAACRAEYDALARTLTAVAALPRLEAAPDLVERSLAAARTAPPAGDRVLVRRTPAWVPAAAAAALVIVAAAAIAPYLLRARDHGVLTGNASPVSEPRLVAVAVPSGGGPSASPGAPAGPRQAPATISDTFFDHSEDVDFVLEPVTLHRGRARTASKLPQGIRGEQAVISF